ncbi:hypothetical protein [Erythrobacter colymbi]|uniref:hypothetical protein n=1 Tax=Erythrobacter colymbi TaxID=1161202 RepID=UPI0012DCB67D|nr:hypothetical protein [Erythrobacter colymbi]
MADFKDCIEYQSFCGSRALPKPGSLLFDTQKGSANMTWLTTGLRGCKGANGAV